MEEIVKDQTIINTSKQGQIRKRKTSDQRRSDSEEILNKEELETTQTTETPETIQVGVKKFAKPFLKNPNLTHDGIMKLSRPERAEVCLQMAMEIIAKQRKVLGNLRLKKWRIIKRANTLKSVVDKLRNNDINSKESQDAIRLYKSMSKSYAG